MASTATVKMPAGRNRCDSGVRTDAAAAGTWLRIRHRLASQLTGPVLSNSAETPNSAAPRPATNPAARAPGTLTGRVGHHHESGEITEPDRRSGPLRPPAWQAADIVPEPGGHNRTLAGTRHRAGLTRSSLLSVIDEATMPSRPGTPTAPAGRRSRCRSPPGGELRRPGRPPALRCARARRARPSREDQRPGSRGARGREPGTAAGRHRRYVTAGARRARGRQKRTSGAVHHRRNSRA
jgi:hypothetical protein